MRVASAAESTPAASTEHSVLVEGQSAPRRQEIVDQRIGRSGVEGDDLAIRAEIGHVADPAPVEDHERALETGGHRRMVDRRERRALASRVDVGRTEVRRRRRLRALPPRARRRRAGASSRSAADAGWSGHAGRPARPSRGRPRTARGTPRPPRHGRRSRRAQARAGAPGLRSGRRQPRADAGPRAWDRGRWRPARLRAAPRRRFRSARHRSRPSTSR